MEENEDLEIGIPRQVISLKSKIKSLRLFSCVLFLHNILFIKNIIVILFIRRMYWLFSSTII